MLPVEVEPVAALEQGLQVPQVELGVTVVFETEQLQLEMQLVVPQFFLRVLELLCCLRVSGFFPP